VEWRFVIGRLEPEPGSSSYLYGVSCTSNVHCFAVGFYSDVDGDTRPSIERWNGNTRQIFDSVDFAERTLTTVSCAAASVTAIR
jgi:hypothetical protein